MTHKIQINRVYADQKPVELEVYVRNLQNPFHKWFHFDLFYERNINLGEGKLTYCSRTEGDT